MTSQDYYLSKLQSLAQGKIAVFIDAANLEKSVQDMWVHPKDFPQSAGSHSPDALMWRIHYKKLKQFFSSIASLLLLRFYTASFAAHNHEEFLALLDKVGYDVVQKPLKIYSDHSDERPHRKANFDVEISVDAATRIDEYDTFILFSGDSDFVYLLNYLRTRGKRVILFSRKGHVAKELFQAVDGYFDIADFRNVFLRVVARKSQKPP